MRHKIVMVGENRPSFKVPPEIPRHRQQPAMEHSQTIAAAEMVLLEVGANGEKVGAALGKLVKRRVGPGRFVEYVCTTQRRRRCGIRRSGFARGVAEFIVRVHRKSQSGVALRLPPHSKMARMKPRPNFRQVSNRQKLKEMVARLRSSAVNNWSKQRRALAVFAELVVGQVVGDQAARFVPEFGADGLGFMTETCAKRATPASQCNIRNSAIEGILFTWLIPAR
jgi:hypothetical protein